MARHRFLVVKGGRSGQRPRDWMILDDPVREAKGGIVGAVLLWCALAIMGAALWRFVL